MRYKLNMVIFQCIIHTSIFIQKIIRLYLEFFLSFVLVSYQKKKKKNKQTNNYDSQKKFAAQHSPQSYLSCHKDASTFNSDKMKLMVSPSLPKRFISFPFGSLGSLNNRRDQFLMVLFIVSFIAHSSTPSKKKKEKER